MTARRGTDARVGQVESVRYGVPGWGTGELWLRGDVVLAHEFHYALAPASPVADAAPSATHELVVRFRAFLAGEPVSFGDVELDLDWATPFQRELTSALRAIPRGEVVTYGELAALAGRPGAARAAGTFCATNRFALVVPCHRVVAAGGIGGYGPDGVPIKRRLLALEGVRL
jgi:methylated-DNA-[protein]-cysteine S-methyltransferase